MEYSRTTQNRPGATMADNDDDLPSADERGAQTDRADGPPIVGIGASAGGIKALNAFFEAMPADVGAAFVVIVHLDPNIRSELAGVLSAHTKLPVTQVTSSTALKPNA